jgi:hypothetical protein
MTRALSTAGAWCLKLGRLNDAVADYDAALGLNAKLASSLYGRGLAKQKKGDTPGASADIAAAKAIRQDIADQFSRWSAI